MSNSWGCKKIVEWFVERHKEWTDDNKLLSWAEKLEINLKRKGKLDDDQLFHLFVLAALWDNKPTYKVEKGEQVFKEIKNDFTLQNFRNAAQNTMTKERLRSIAYDTIQNPKVFNLLMFIANGKLNGESVWVKIRKILESPVIGNKEDGVTRCKQLHQIINQRKGEMANLSKKLFLIFRELRIQFRRTGKYQYHPAICCVPDSHVQQALLELGLLNKVGRDINHLIKASEIVAEHFCTKGYELYDLPLFLWHREKEQNSQKETGPTRPIRSGTSGTCPRCGSLSFWRKARALHNGLAYFRKRK